MKHLLTLIMLLFLAACTNDESVNEECTKKYPNNFFSRVDCFGNLAKERAEERRLAAIKEAERQAQADREAEERRRNAAAEREREEAAAKIRPCLASDIVRMEQLVKQTQALITHSSTLAEIQPIIREFLKNQESNNVFNPFNEAEIVPAEDDIKKRVLVFRIFSTCTGTQFTLLVNVTADPAGKLLKYGVWASNSPKGYKTGYIDDLAVDYVQQREAANKAAARSNGTPPTSQVASDPCAPNLTPQQRLDRLKQYGPLKQTSERSFEAGWRSITFSSYGNQLLSCR
jgi:hypothetical protein